MREPVKSAKFRVINHETEECFGIIFSCLDDYNHISHSFSSIWGNDPWLHKKGTYTLQRLNGEEWVDTEHVKYGKK